MSRWFSVLVLCLALLASAVTAVWDEKDHRIFDLNDALVSLKGKDVNFYSILQSAPTASASELNKAYRKISLAVHPDKNPDPEAGKLYQILTGVISVLKDTESREKYDYHLKNGIPRWRGTGYYYQRYRPGFFVITVFILACISFVQFASAWAIYYRDLARAKEDAQLLNQVSGKAKKALKKSKKSGAAGSKTSLNEGSAEEVPEIELPIPPSYKDVILMQLPLWVVSTVASLASGKKEKEEDVAVDGDAEVVEDAQTEPGSGKLGRRKKRGEASGTESEAGTPSISRRK
ncbi:DnaJ domain-containing protein [Cladochytrium replicatum]|nr:DnaJ domain-containing protein [Cladochytrium replicatum]